MANTGMTLYEILDVDSDASEDDIRRAYRKLAIALHPDRNPDPSAEEAMRMVNDAWTTLGDPTKRRAYDEELLDRRDPTTNVPVDPSGFAEHGEDDGIWPSMHRLRVPVTAIILALLLAIFIFSAYAPRR